ncbi:MAG TPA: hypothetical protein VK509_19590 [Polyangiales bacterium]|nr:hypothetical protein [Polyangiales bacterium]
MNEGLAVPGPNGWSFLCPSLWGDENSASGKAPLAASIDGVTSFVVGADDLYLARDGVLTPAERPELSGAALIELAAEGDALYGLKVTSEGSALIRVDGASKPALYTSAEHFASLVANTGRFHLGRFSQTGELIVTTLDLEGQMIAENRVQMGLTSAQLRLRPSAQRMFAVLIDEGHYALGELGDRSWQPIAQVDAPIEGPEASPDGQLWISVEGVLMRETASGFEAVGETRSVTCLGRSGSWAYACAGPEVYRLENEGLGERIFDLARLAPPDPAHVSAAAADACQIQWVLFHGDLQRVGLSPLDEPLPSSPPSGLDAGSAGAAATDAGGRASDGASERDDSADESGCAVSRARPGSAPAWPARVFAAGVWAYRALRARRRRRSATCRDRGTAALV